MFRNSRRLPSAAFAMVLIGLVSTSGLFASSWSSFAPATVSGLHITPALESGVVNYTVTLDSDATITVSSGTYSLDWIQSFYILGREDSDTFTASKGASANNWTWDESSNPGQTAGWVGNGGERILSGGSKTFEFGKLTFAPNKVIPGFHLAYQTPDGQVTGPYRTTFVPEPSSLLGLASLFGGLAAWRRRGQ